MKQKVLADDSPELFVLKASVSGHVAPLSRVCYNLGMTQEKGTCRAERGVRNQRVNALSISGPVFDVVRREDLTGQVLASYRRACNLVTSDGEVIALVGPAIGNGPLNIVIGGAEVLDQVKPGLSVAFSNHQLVLDHSLVVSLDGAQLWRPEVSWECLATQRRRLEGGLAVLCGWLSRNEVAKGLLGLSASQAASRGGSHAAETRAWEPALLCPEPVEGLQNRDPLNLAFLAMAQAGIKGLLHALQGGDRSSIRESAALLAGLGPGLTPAGDDYLVGLMAGLRVWPDPLENSGLSPPQVCQIIFEAAEGRTTLLSRAFLRSAKEGLFGENWHELLTALVEGETIGIQRAARRILSSGATSGADALAGFLSPYLYT
jgi:hypothetical protein